MTAAPHSPGVSSCPACRYDLTGTPTPICPECGIDAVAEMERRRKLREARVHRFISWPPETLLVLAFAFAFSQPAVRDSRSWWDNDPALSSLFGAWILGGVWLWHRRSYVLVQARLAWLVPYVALLFIAACLSLQPRWRWDDRYRLDTATYVLSGSVALTAAIWVCTKGRASRSLLLILGVLVAAPGTMLSLVAAASTAGGIEWSPFMDPRPGQIHDQYPLRWDEVQLVAPVILLAGVCLLIAGLLVGSRRRQPPPLTVSPTHRITPSLPHPPTPLTVSSVTPPSPPSSPCPCPPATSPPSRRLPSAP